MWSDVILSRPDGQQVMSSAAPAEEALPAVRDPDVFARVIATRQPMIGDLRVGGVRQPWFPVHVPVVRNGQVLYVLSALVTSTAFSDVLRREAPLPDEWVRGIVDGRGVIVARSRDGERFVGQRGTAAFLERYAIVNDGVYRDVALDGTPVYGAFSHAPYSRWLAGVAVSRTVVGPRIRRSV